MNRLIFSVCITFDIRAITCHHLSNDDPVSLAFPVSFATLIDVSTREKNNNMLPKAARIPHAMTLHGDTRIDNYYWLRDDTRSQPEVLDYLQQEIVTVIVVMASQQACRIAS
ncbi:hypothetical protein [Shigella flexneri]|uniref:hypothetical protein n=1 Tax=Shigella flexneri TaxID=623 RepID=UPI0027DD8A8C|nr:hypothetical protein [Shigella flexneri]